MYSCCTSITTTVPKTITEVNMSLLVCLSLPLPYTILSPLVASVFRVQGFAHLPLSICLLSFCHMNDSTSICSLWLILLNMTPSSSLHIVVKGKILSCSLVVLLYVYIYAIISYLLLLGSWVDFRSWLF